MKRRGKILQNANNAGIAKEHNDLCTICQGASTALYIILFSVIGTLYCVHSRAF